MNYTSIFDGAKEFFTSTTTSISQKALSLTGDLVPEGSLTKLFVVLVGLVLIYLGSKVTQKVLKFILIILGAILAIGIILSFFSGG